MKPKEGYIIFVVDKSPAHKVYMKLAMKKPKPGQIVPVSAEEMESLEKDVYILDLP